MKSIIAKNRKRRLSRNLTPPPLRRRHRHVVFRVISRLALATMLGDTPAGRMIVIFPRMRLRWALAVGLLAAVFRAILAARTGRVTVPALER